MFDEILECLQDGESHSFSEVFEYLRSKCHTPIPSEKQVRLGLALLKAYDFVNSVTAEMQPDHEFWYAHRTVVIFLKKIKEVETT